jgi:hypothetical protein
MPHDWQRGLQSEFRWVVPKDECASEVRFPRIEYRAEVAEHDVVGAHDPVRRIFAVWVQRIWPGADDPLVPEVAYPEYFFRQVAYGITGPPLRDPSGDQSVLPDRCKQLGSFRLRLDQPRGSLGLSLAHFPTLN